MSKRLLLLPCLLVLSGLVLAACGSSNSEESKVEEAIETAATSTNPADCAKTQTQKFMEQITKESGQAALKSCEKEAEEGENAESVTISNVEVEGSNATAEVALSGGGLDGQTLEVALVEEGGQWKVNEAVRFTKFDSAKLVETFEREIKKAGEAGSKFATCFLEGLKRADRAEVEKLFLEGSGAGFEEIAKSCK